MLSIAIVDAGPLYAWADDHDEYHPSCRDIFARADLEFIIPTLVVAEVTYFLGRRLGAHAEATFLRTLRDFEVESPQPADWQRIADLVERYAEFPLGGTDASVIALAERLGTDLVITLDRRHFGAVQPRHVTALRLLPD